MAFLTLIEISACSTPASRVSTRNEVSSEAGTPLRTPGPSTTTLCGSKFGNTCTLNGLEKKKTRTEHQVERFVRREVLYLWRIG